MTHNNTEQRLKKTFLHVLSRTLPIYEIISRRYEARYVTYFRIASKDVSKNVIECSKLPQDLGYIQHIHCYNDDVAGEYEWLACLGAKTPTR